MRQWIVKAETQNRRSKLIGLDTAGKTLRFTGPGLGLAQHKSAGRMFGWVWDWTYPCLRSKPRPLTGCRDPLLTLIWSVQRVMQLDEWINAAWWLPFIRVCSAHWPLLLWLVWHHSKKKICNILSLSWFWLSHLTVTGKTLSSLLVVYQLDLECGTFAWAVWPLHTHRQIIMTHNLFTAIKHKLTCSKMGKQIAFTRNMSSKRPIWLSNPPATVEPSPCLRPKPMSVW